MMVTPKSCTAIIGDQTYEAEWWWQEDEGGNNFVCFRPLAVFSGIESGVESELIDLADTGSYTFKDFKYRLMSGTQTIFRLY
jgi:hypothetical protein